MSTETLHKRFLAGMLALMESLPGEWFQRLFDAFLRNPYAALALEKLWEEKRVETLPDPPNPKSNWKGFRFIGDLFSGRVHTCFWARDADDPSLISGYCTTGQLMSPILMRDLRGDDRDYSRGFTRQGHYMSTAPGAICIDGHHIEYARPENTVYVASDFLPNGDLVALLRNRKTSQYEIHNLKTGKVIKCPNARRIFEFVAGVDHNVLFAEERMDGELYMVNADFPHDDGEEYPVNERRFETTKVSEPCQIANLPEPCFAAVGEDGPWGLCYGEGKYEPTQFDGKQFDITVLFCIRTGWAEKFGYVLRDITTKKVYMVMNGQRSPAYDEIFSVRAEEPYLTFGARRGREILHVSFDP